jgi:transposase
VISISIICERCRGDDAHCEHCGGRGYKRRQIRLRERHAGVSIDVQERIIWLYTHGASLREVARQVFVDSSTVRRVLRDYAIPLRPRGGSRPTMTLEQMLEVGELYASGMSIREVAQAIGLSESGVKQRLDRLDGHRRTRSEAIALAHKRGRYARGEQTS